MKINLVILFYVGVILLVQQVIYNPTISLPRGYYFTYPGIRFKPGDIVLICVSDQLRLRVMHKLGLPYTDDDCRSHTPYLLKQIVAIAGDRVEITREGVRVNGYLYPHSQSFNSYHMINLLPQPLGEFQLKNGEFFVLGQTTYSYDSRYFGVIHHDEIYRKAKFLLPKHFFNF